MKNVAEEIIKNINNENLKVWLNGYDLESFNNKNNQKKSLSINECIKKCKSPNRKEIFNALTLFKPQDTKVLILGQDPYPDDDEYRVNHYGRRAHGLAFSFANSKGIHEPADDSLLNIFKAIDKYKNKSSEKNSDIYEWDTNLENWAKNKGILLLNTSLTYEKYCGDLTNKDSIEEEQKKLLTKHKNAWEPFIKEIITNLIKSKIDNNDKNNKLAIFLWGKYAQNVFFQSINEIMEIIKSNIINKDIFNNELYKSKSKIKFKVVNKVMKNKKGLELVENKIKIFRTSHPSQISENNDGKFIAYSPNHFEACDNFLFNDKTKEYIWKNFPENNKKQ